MLSAPAQQIKSHLKAWLTFPELNLHLRRLFMKRPYVRLFSVFESAGRVFEASSVIAESDKCEAAVILVLFSSILSRVGPLLARHIFKTPITSPWHFCAWHNRADDDFSLWACNPCRRLQMGFLLHKAHVCCRFHRPASYFLHEVLILGCRFK